MRPTVRPDALGERSVEAGERARKPHAEQVRPAGVGGDHGVARRLRRCGRGAHDAADPIGGERDQVAGRHDDRAAVRRAARSPPRRPGRHPDVRRRRRRGRGRRATVRRRPGTRRGRTRRPPSAVATRTASATPSTSINDLSLPMRRLAPPHSTTPVSAGITARARHARRRRGRRSGRAAAGTGGTARPRRSRRSLRRASPGRTGSGGIPGCPKSPSARSPSRASHWHGARRDHGGSRLDTRRSAR